MNPVDRTSSSKSANAGRPSRRLARRAAFLTIHKYIGLVLGLIIAITGLSGSILVFREEMEAAAIPDMDTGRGDPPLGLDRMIVMASSAAKPGLFPKRVHLETLADPARPWRIEMSDATGRLSDLYLHPATGNIVFSREAGTFLDWVFDLHVYLLAGRTGQIAQGVVAGFLILSTLAGLYLWWPKPGRWRRALRLRWPNATDLKLRELHNASGAYLLPFIIIAALTGIVMTFPEAAQRVVLLGKARDESAPKGWQVEPGSLTPETALDAVRRNYPDAVPELMVFPKGPGGNIGLAFSLADRPKAASRTFLLLDSRSGELLYRLDPQRDGFADLLDDYWSFHLHNGALGGLAGRIIACATGVALALLFITGCWLWLWKRNAIARQAARRRGAKA